MKQWAYNCPLCLALKGNYDKKALISHISFQHTVTELAKFIAESMEYDFDG